VNTAFPYLEALVLAIERIGFAAGHWHFFQGRPREGFAMSKVEEKLRRLPYCHVCRPGRHYLDSLIQSRIAAIYGG
jgi:hypothetical protein